MASDLSQADLVVKAMSDMEKHLEIEKESLLKRLELIDADLFNVREAKRIFLTNRSVSSADELATLKDDNSMETDRRGTPESWLYPQYKLVGSKKAIEQILEERKEPVEIEDLVKVLYDTKSEDEFKRARNSLSAGLRRGAEEGAWKKVGRSFYQSNSDGEGSHRFSLLRDLIKKRDLDPVDLEPIESSDAHQNNFEAHIS